MRLVLDAIRAAGPRRRAVIDAALRPRGRRSVLGRYEVLGRGDVSEARFAEYRLEGGRLRFSRLLR
jgi:hypothetical protein